MSLQPPHNKDELMAVHKPYTYKTSNGCPTHLEHKGNLITLHPSYTHKACNNCPTHLTHIRQVYAGPPTFNTQVR